MKRTIYIAILEHGKDLNDQDRPAMRLIKQLQAQATFFPCEIVLLSQSITCCRTVTRQTGNLTYLRTRNNYGCAGGRQKIVDYILAEDEYKVGDIIVFLDDDIEVIDSSWLDELIAPIINGKATVVGHEGRKISPDYHTEIAMDNPDYVSGGWSAWAFEVFARGEVEFDTRFFAYWEDADICQQLKQIGYQIHAKPVGLYHPTGVPNDAKRALYEAGRTAYMEKWRV